MFPYPNVKSCPATICLLDSTPDSPQRQNAWTGPTEALLLFFLVFGYVEPSCLTVEPVGLSVQHPLRRQTRVRGWSLGITGCTVNDMVNDPGYVMEMFMELGEFDLVQG